ncbi:unnamed protein product [Allacma fusca]|uniref:ZP domain-containing protein n=1 Tax=Allacma fusca TaxID=39272 RepID=A0A8J2Q612_9HEXA|nr:unnamed protein product [Allacma fusca]
METGRYSGSSPCNCHPPQLAIACDLAKWSQGTLIMVNGQLQCDSELSRMDSVKLVKMCKLRSKPMCQFNLFSIVLLLCGIFVGSSFANVSTRIACEDDEMRVDITGTNQIIGAHLQGLKNYPDASCRPEYIEESHLQFRLALKDFYRCGTTQILNKLTGTRTFYNRVVILVQEDGGKEEEYQVLVKCQLESPAMPQLDGNHLNSTVREKRDVLPAGFQEPETITIERKIENKAPEPMLSMYVRQEGHLIGPELIVQPGSPLTMEVSLDSVSKEIYGILVSQLEVTDSGPQSEVILLNGCSVDPYLFENFITNDGDLLMAKFRAFKFPDSNFILFRGTVNVCLGSCEGVPCRSGQLGYGRKRRAVSRDPQDTNQMYEVHMTRILRVASPNLDVEEERRAIIGIRGNDAKLTRNAIEAELRGPNGSSSNCVTHWYQWAIVLAALLAHPLLLIPN